MNRLQAQKKRVKLLSLKSLLNLYLYIDPDSLLQIRDWLESVKLLLDAKHPLILLCQHALTRLVIFYEHIETSHTWPFFNANVTMVLNIL